MSRGIKVKGFFADIGGAKRIVAARENLINMGSSVPNPKDFVKEITDKLHPASMKFKVTDIRDSSPTSKTYRLESEDGYIPVFQSGQYVNFRLKIGESILTRPYSISSAPYEARTDKPFIDITIRRNRPYLVPDYFFNNVKVGDVLDGNMPFGTFYWEPLRDTKNIVAIAGGSGITPFYSMAKEVASGKMKDCSLTIIYGSVNSEDIVLKDELDKVAAECDRVKVINVLSDDDSWQGEKGFVDKSIIEKYSTDGCTYMFCGPLPMFTPVKDSLKEMGVHERRFRHDVIGNPKDVTILPGYPKGKAPDHVKITVVRGIQEDVIDADTTEPVAVALERAGIPVDTHCRGGECGYCRSQLLIGDIFVSPYGDGRRMMDKELGWFHACSTWPLSDLKIKVPII